MRECRRDISESSGAFGADRGISPTWFLNVHEGRKEERERKIEKRERSSVCCVVLVAVALAWHSPLLLLSFLLTYLRDARWTSAPKETGKKGRE